MGTVKFNVSCEMDERWMAPFLSMLKRMQSFGENGHSGIVGLYADGDGDFRPRFESDAESRELSPYPDWEQGRVLDDGKRVKISVYDADYDKEKKR